LDKNRKQVILVSVKRGTLKAHYDHIKNTLSDWHYLKLPEWQTLAEVSKTHQTVAEQENTDNSTDQCPVHLLETSYLNDNGNETIRRAHW